MSKWSVSFKELTESIGEEIEDVAKKATFDLFSDVVRRSPVGNPELWIVNESKGRGRSSRDLYLEYAAKYNEENPGKKRAGTGKSTLDKLFPLASGKGYTGGRFRANWNVSIGTADESVTDTTDVQRSAAEVQKVFSLPAGQVFFLTNGLPYALPLEYGHSTQAPNGMVRLAAQLFNDHVSAAIK